MFPVKPLTTINVGKIPAGKKPRKKLATSIRSAARQEVSWSEIAKKEGVDEKKRSQEYKKTNPALAKELNWDSKIAFDFAKVRKERAVKLTRIADRISR
jgi:hypothetical protein